MLKLKIERADIMPLDDFQKIREAKRQEMIQLRRKRRIDLSPDISLCFENYHTMWWQIHEMLWIEKGGEQQIQDELMAYNPLIPNGYELIATFMIAIDDPEVRRHRLRELIGIEQTIKLRFANYSIKAIPVEDENRTTEDGKTSSIHFLRFPLSPVEIEFFCVKQQDVVFEVDHPLCRMKTLISESIRRELSGDLVSSANYPAATPFGDEITKASPEAPKKDQNA